MIKKPIHPWAPVALGALMFGCGTDASSDGVAPTWGAGASSATTTTGAASVGGAASDAVATDMSGSAGSNPSAGALEPGASATSVSLPSSDPLAADPAAAAPTSASTAVVVTYQPPALAPAELPARTWKLTHAQYRAAVEALLGVQVDTSLFVPDASNGVYENFSSVGLVRVDLANNYLDTARQIANELSASELGALTSCNVSAACADAFISELATRAFRRPPRVEETTAYRDLFDLGASEGDAQMGFRAVVQGLLNSPNFLYRTELGDPSDETSQTVSLTGYEVAQLLSFSILDQPPPDWLTVAAAAGDLTNAQTLAPHVERLLTDPNALTQLTHFLSQWLEVGHFDQVNKFEETFPGFDAARQAMTDETVAFLGQYGTTQNTLAELLLSPVPSQGRLLDQFYGSGASPVSGAQRLGVLALGTVLSQHAKPYLTSPTQRGTFVRSRFFCQNITLPSGFTPPPLSETEQLGLARTTRELYEQHQDDPTCATCHRLVDNIGFSLEEFDGAGRFRTIDDTQGFAEPVDSVSELTDSDVNRPITSHIDLAQALSESELVRQCMAVQAFRFYFGQGESTRGLPPIVSGHSALQGGGNLGQLVAGLMTTESTWRRSRQ